MESQDGTQGREALQGSEAHFKAMLPEGDEFVAWERARGLSYETIWNTYFAPTYAATKEGGHDCEENAVPYKSDGALGHGWKCSVCGGFLQAG